MPVPHRWPGPPPCTSKSLCGDIEQYTTPHKVPTISQLVTPNGVLHCSVSPQHFLKHTLCKEWFRPPVLVTFKETEEETTTANIAKHTLTNKWIREPATPSHHAACKVEYQTFNQSNSQKTYFLKVLHTCQPRCQKTHLVSLNPEHKHVCSPICLLLQENKLMASCGTECVHQNTITFHFLSVRHYSWIQWRVCLLIMSLVLLTFA